ncbi:hypothetical protein N7510_004573 [Penicillium lagena]|uniref:uncharacterized protein n=1 Tax=Penicillium lagena TaxID=94218 RepID=UPI0025411D5B|nr:uncharacterized protein N7510_004573 [Penicillium lagena]KAJ5620589.1 hypothetical protein N7510_004573 [Penicillium lagena]
MNMNAQTSTIPGIPDFNHPNSLDFTPQAPVIPRDDLLSDAQTASESGTWFLEDGFDVSALDFSITSTISEWAQLPGVFAAPTLPPGEQAIFTPVQSSAPETDPTKPNEDAVKLKWFTHMEHRPDRDYLAAQPGFPGVTSANEMYRAGLSHKLRPRMEDEALPTSDQLNLFAKLYFHRFHPLLPVIHAASFRPTAENALLFLSICSVGSLFVGSSRAVMQGSRIFERLNKAILASWESFLSQSRPDALSMVQAAILGQTYAILSGNPKYLILADVLHGTVAAWAREANRLGSICQRSRDLTDDTDLEENWHQWIDSEQRARAQVALNIHDAELAALLHHQPIRNHRFRQHPRLAPDSLFAAPTASKWATLDRNFLQTQGEDPIYPRPSRSPYTFPDRDRASHFTAYGLLESINARLVDAKQSHEFDHIVCQDISNLLIDWWKTYHTPNQEPFCLPVLWHSIFIALYADLDLLEQAIGRDGDTLTLEALAPVHKWASSLNASRCLVHACLIAQYLERMSLSVEPAIHVPRALFSASLTYLCVARYAPKHVISAEAFVSPEIKLLGEEARQGVCSSENSQRGGGSVVADLDHLYRLIDLLQRGGRWGISQAFASVLSAALEEGRGISASM